MVNKVKQDIIVIVMPCAQILQEALTVSVSQDTVEMESNAQVSTTLIIHIKILHHPKNKCYTSTS